ncbi:MAG: hypothetical protein H7293_21515 [Candidatus Saccharibacteria bacterium]|nr:hypothetical protein [Rhodoferax sp.]
MSVSLRKPFVIALGSAIALALFWVGMSYPLDLRVRGDALGYLKIADSFNSFASVWTYAGERTIGLPLFEFAIRQALSLFSPTVYLLPWINAIGIAMLAIHLIASWLFSIWSRRAGLFHASATGYVLFVYLATSPALVGHTTSPLSDTFSIDLILLGLVALASALQAERTRIHLLYCGLAAGCLAFSVLVRPASLLGLGAALLACGLVTLRGPPSSRITIGAVVLGSLLLLAVPSWNCAEKYGSACLQSPKTFNANLSMQDGLRGGRLMWSQKNDFPGTIPMVTDASMFDAYYRSCRIESSIGFSDTSLMGCLLARPLTLPAFVAKKWIGLFDYFRFTPYMENLTPTWLRILSRAYGALAWLGLTMCIVTVLALHKQSVRTIVRAQLTTQTGLVFLATYSAVMLAQHTALHTEERYGFPLIPICAAVLFGYGERAIVRYRSGRGRSIEPWLVLCAMALTLFVVQISAWDRLSFAQG